MDRAGITAIAGFLAVLLVADPAVAVTVEIDLVTEGEPVPEATVTFETVEGEPIETTTTQAAEPPAADGTTPAVALVTLLTDEAGRLAVELDDEHEGKAVVAVIEKDGKVVKRQPIPATESPTRIEAFDPADALVAVTVTQGEACRAGRDCPFAVAIENQGTGIYEGPLFVELGTPGDWARAAAQAEGWFCAPAGRGGSLCGVQLPLEPGATVRREFSVRLPGHVAAQSSCAAIRGLAPGAEDRGRRLVAAIQLGLARAGFDAGPADGVLGRRTGAAIEAFLTKAGRTAESEEALFDIIYGYPLDKVARLGHAARPACERLALVAQPRPRRVTREVDRDRAPPRRGGGLDPALGIGIGIGLGILRNQGRHDDHD